jgi:hypothetical protein
MMTTERTGNGTFNVLWDGERTRYTIVNGSLGVSGRGRNTYGIVWGSTKSERRWLGSLASCKKAVSHWLSKSNKL